MTINGSYYDLDSPQRNIRNALIRDGGAEIAFDFELEGYTYTVVLRRYNGSWFRGEATSRPGSDVAELRCRVFEDHSEEARALVLVGHTWQYPGGGNSSWMVELEFEED